MSTATQQRGTIIAEQLGIGTEGHDLKVACVACNSSDGMRIDQAAGKAWCFVCESKWSPYDLAVAILDKPQAIQLMVEVGKFEPRENDNGNGKLHEDIVATVARLKHIPIESLKAYGARADMKGKAKVCRVPVYNSQGEQHSYFDIPEDGGKGWFRKGDGSSGLFLPGRLPQPGEVWYCVEGGKDAAALHGLGFMAVGLNTSKLAVKYVRLFRGVDVVIVPDRNRAGEDGAEITAARLYGVARSVRVATLPAEFKEKDGADVRDVLAIKDGEDLLRQALEDSREWEPAVTDSGVPDERGETISNAKVIEIKQDDGELKKITVPLAIEEIKKTVFTRTGNWPRRVGSALFIDDPDHGIGWLSKTETLFGWLGSKTGVVRWHPRLMGAVSRGELYADLRRTVQPYDAVEELPHEPTLATHYYTCGTPKPGDGKTLAKLIDRFNPATPIDRDLILAMFATPIWGGSGGTRPAFVVTSDDGMGSGKSKLVALCGFLCGGMIEISPNEDVGILKQRLLSDEALTKRIALIDNVKSLKFSWAELESLVTTPAISGKKMYVGESTRPNTLTWIITLNGVSLGADLAQRSVIVKLSKPTYSGTFEEDCRQFIDANRDAILFDLIGFLRSKPKPLNRYSRWGAWERDVLSRLPDPLEAQTTILERPGEADADQDEADILEDYFAGQLRSLDYKPDSDRVHIPTSIVARWFNWALNEKVTVPGVSRALNGWIKRGDLKYLQQNSSRNHGRGFLWVGRDAEPTDYAAYDIQQRITHRKEQ